MHLQKLEDLLWSASVYATVKTIQQQLQSLPPNGAHVHRAISLSQKLLSKKHSLESTPSMTFGEYYTNHQAQYEEIMSLIKDIRFYFAVTV